MKDISEFIVTDDSTVRQCMNKMERNMCKVVFIISRFTQKLVGSLSDGDIRRYILSDGSIDDNVLKASNPDVVVVSESQLTKLSEYLSKKPNLLIPIVDSHQRIIRIANREKSHYYPIYSPSLDGNEINYLTECIETNWISSKGSYVTRFEGIFEDLIGSERRFLSVCNGTQALFLGLKAHGIGLKDKVIVPSLTFAASVNAIIHCGAEPLFADVDEDSWCLSIASVLRLLKHKPKAIVSVDLYGNCPQYDQLKQICESYNILLIEDGAESLGTQYNGRHVGSESDVISFSFFGNKTITTGEGGMVGFKDNETFKNALMLRDHGMDSQVKYWHQQVGYNLRMTNLQAAVGVAQMERFESVVEKKRLIHSWYNSKLNVDYLRQQETTLCVSSWWLNSYRLCSSPESIKSVIAQAQSKGVEIRRGFFPLHYMNPYKHFIRDTLLNTELIANQIISLPSSPSLTEYDIDYISSILNHSNV